MPRAHARGGFRPEASNSAPPFAATWPARARNGISDREPDDGEPVAVPRDPSRRARANPRREGPSRARPGRLRRHRCPQPAGELGQRLVGPAAEPALEAEVTVVAEIGERGEHPSPIDVTREGLGAI